MVPLLLLSGCNRKEIIRNPSFQEEEPVLGLAVNFPASEFTKAAGDLSGTGDENALHSLTVWVFRSTGHSLVACKSIPPADFPPEGGVRRYSLPVERSFANNPSDVDIFVLANEKSIGITLPPEPEEVTWDYLNDKTFGGDFFGVSSPTNTEDLEENGLPMSAVGKNMTVSGELPILKVETLSLSRAVSRIRFVFCKTATEGATENVEISEVKLSGGQIPLKEYVFTTGATGIYKYYGGASDDYESAPVNLDVPASIADNEAPEAYIYANQNPQVYQDLIDDAVRNGLLTDMGYLYFRESDKRLVGSIKYIIDNQTHTREFSMNAAGDFARNHSWTLLGYFLSGRNLQLATSVLPWDYNTYTIQFKDQAVVATGKFKVDEDPEHLKITKTAEGLTVQLGPGAVAQGHLSISAPVGGKLMIMPVGDADAFLVSPEVADIFQNGQDRVNITIRRNPDAKETSGKSITLSFSVVIGERDIDANSELIDDKYTFVL
jgi:hypothetical protein